MNKSNHCKEMVLIFVIMKTILINEYLNVTGSVGLAAFLGAFAGFVTLLLVLFLYLARKLTPPVTQTALFGGICVPLHNSTNCPTAPVSKNLGMIKLSVIIFVRREKKGIFIL